MSSEITEIIKLRKGTVKNVEFFVLIKFSLIAYLYFVPSYSIF